MPRPSCNFCLVVRRVGSFSYTPRAGICLVVKRISSFSYTPCVRICLAFCRVGNLSYTHRVIMSCFWFVIASITDHVVESVGSFGGWGVCHKCPMHVPRCNPSHRSAGGESLLHAPCWNLSGRVSGGKSLTSTVLTSVSSFGEWGICITCHVLDICLGWGDCLKRRNLSSGWQHFTSG